MHSSKGTLEFRIAPMAARAIVTGTPICTACCSACLMTASLREGTFTEARVDLKRVASRTYAALYMSEGVNVNDRTKGPRALDL